MMVISPFSKNQRGFTLTELSLVLGVVGLVLGAIWSATAVVSESHKASKAAQEIYTIANNMRALYGSKNGFTAGSLTSAMLTEGGIFPPDMLDANGVPQNPWGTTTLSGGGIAEVVNGHYVGVSVGSQAGWGECTAGATAANVLEIVVWGLTNQQCIDLSSQFIGPGAGSDVLCIYNDGTGSYPGAVNPSPANTDPSQLSGCNGNFVIYLTK